MLLKTTEDHVVQIDGATWEDYERFLEIRVQFLDRRSALEAINDFRTALASRRE